MTDAAWWSVLLGIAGGLLVLWLAVVLVLWLVKPDGARLADSIRLLPDIVRLLGRLAADRALPRRARLAIAATTAYLALPVDIIPDFLPVIGFADDAIVVALVLRYVVRQAGSAALERQWPGTPDGLTAVRRLCRLPE